MISPQKFPKHSLSLHAKCKLSFKQQVEDLIAQGLKDLNVVTREDYDKQIEKLSKAEAKLAELETRLAALEK